MSLNYNMMMTRQPELLQFRDLRYPDNQTDVAPALFYKMWLISTVKYKKGILTLFFQLAKA